MVLYLHQQLGKIRCLSNIAKENVMDEELLTDKELCSILRISPATLSRHQDGTLRRVKRVMVGDRRRWVKSSVDEFCLALNKIGEEK